MRRLFPILAAVAAFAAATIGVNRKAAAEAGIARGVPLAPGLAFDPWRARDELLARGLIIPAFVMQLAILLHYTPRMVRPVAIAFGIPPALLDLDTINSMAAFGAWFRLVCEAFDLDAHGPDGKLLISPLLIFGMVSAELGDLDPDDLAAINEKLAADIEAEIARSRAASPGDLLGQLNEVLDVGAAASALIGKLGPKERAALATRFGLGPDATADDFKTAARTEAANVAARCRQRPEPAERPPAEPVDQLGDLLEIGATLAAACRRPGPPEPPSAA